MTFLPYLGVLAVIGTDGILEMLNEDTGNYTTALIIHRNILSNQVEKVYEPRGCNISNVSVMTGKE